MVVCLGKWTINKENKCPLLDCKILRSEADFYYSHIPLSLVEFMTQHNYLVNVYWAGMNSTKLLTLVPWLWWETGLHLPLILRERSSVPTLKIKKLSCREIKALGFKTCSWWIEIDSRAKNPQIRIFPLRLKISMRAWHGVFLHASLGLSRP